MQVVRKLAKFLGIPLTEEEESSGVAQEVVRLSSFEMLTSLKLTRLGALATETKFTLIVPHFIEGKVWYWVNHMSREMGEKLDHIVQQKLQGLGLCFESILLSVLLSISISTLQNVPYLYLSQSTVQCWK